MATEPLSLPDLARIGSDALAKMALAGEIRGRHLWVAVKGANRYKAAMRRGDVADECTQQDRAVACNNCPSAHRHPLPAVGAVATFCGAPFEEHLDAATPICGCLVALTVDGGLFAAGRAVVGSERCPQGKW